MKRLNARLLLVFVIAFANCLFSHSAKATLADQATFNISAGTPPVNPSPLGIGAEGVVKFKVSLYTKNAQGAEDPKAGVKLQNYSIAAQSADATIVSVSSGFLITNTKQSAMMSKSGNNSGTSFDVSVTIRFSGAGTKSVGMNGNVVFTDGSNLSSSQGINLTVSDSQNTYLSPTKSGAGLSITTDTAPPYLEPKASPLDPDVPAVLMASAGEKLTFTAIFGDTDYLGQNATDNNPDSITGIGPYDVVMDISGGASFSLTASVKTQPFSDTSSASNVYVYIDKTWTGTAFTVKATLKDKAVAVPQKGTANR